MKADGWRLSYDDNLVRIQPKGEESFGTLKITG